MPKVKVTADNELNGSENIIFVFQRVENIVGKGENAVYQHFLLLQIGFQ